MSACQYDDVCENLRSASSDYPEIEDLLEESAEAIENLYDCWMGEIEAHKITSKDLESVVSELMRLKYLMKNKKRANKKEEK